MYLRLFPVLPYTTAWPEMTEMTEMQAIAQNLAEQNEDAAEVDKAQVVERVPLISFMRPLVEGDSATQRGVGVARSRHSMIAE